MYAKAKEGRGSQTTEKKNSSKILFEEKLSTHKTR